MKIITKYSFMTLTLTLYTRIILMSLERNCLLLVVHYQPVCLGIMPVFGDDESIKPLRRKRFVTVWLMIIQAASSFISIGLYVYTLVLTASLTSICLTLFFDLLFESIPSTCCFFVYTLVLFVCSCVRLLLCESH